MVDRAKAFLQHKIKVNADEFKRGKLRSSSGQKVTKPSQMLAIAYSEAAKVKKK